MEAAITLRRRDGAEDAEAVAALILESNAYYSALAPDFFTAIEHEGLVEWLAADEAGWLTKPTSLALVAETENEVAGYLEAAIRPVGDDARFSGNRDLREPSLYINALLTAQKHQRKGIATRLVEAAESWALGQGVSLSVCDTFLRSPQSIPFWESRMGYERRSVQLRKRLRG